VAKKWVIRSIVTPLVALTLAMVSAGVAQADGVKLNLENTHGELVARARYVDDGDIFYLWDELANGYGPTLSLQWYLGGKWVTVKSLHNTSGNGSLVDFSYDINSDLYRMKLCEGDVDHCAYSTVFNE
jgi:hypothetical protein